MTLKMTVTGDAPGDTPMARYSWSRAAATFADVVDPAVTAALRAKAPVAQVNGGAYKKSIRCERSASSTSTTLRFGSSVPYAPYVTSPTRPHTIVPNAASVLRFQNSAGAVVFTKRVNHPGTRGNDFNKTVLTAMGPAIRDALLSAVALAQGV
jgi:hypothetical protein